MAADSQRHALVTGASSGIGEATARALAGAGYRVAVLARRAQRLEQLIEELPPAVEGSGGGGAHLALPCDLRQPARIEASLERLGEEFGHLDLLVNNAGVGYRAKVEELQPETLTAVFETNVVALLLVCRAALPWLRASERGVVVNVASVVGRRGVPGQAAYSASKAAVCSIGEALRVEWAQEGIEVCTLNPALTATGFFEAQANPAELAHPDLSGAAPAEAVARAVLALDRSPRPELSLRWKWRLLGVLSVLTPRFADRLLVDRLGGPWKRP